MEPLRGRLRSVGRSPTATGPLESGRRSRCPLCSRPSRCRRHVIVLTLKPIGETLEVPAHLNLSATSARQYRRTSRVRIPHDPHRFGRSLIVEDHPSWQRRFSVTSAAPTPESSPRCDGFSSVFRILNPSWFGFRPKTTPCPPPLVTATRCSKASTYPRRSLRSPDPAPRAGRAEPSAA